MINNVVLVGKVLDLPQMKETALGNHLCSLDLEVQRSFPNADGVYESDIVNITLWKGMADEAVAHVDKGSLLGVRGRIQSYDGKSKAGNDYRALNVVAEYIFNLNS